MQTSSRQALLMPRSPDAFGHQILYNQCEHEQRILLDPNWSKIPGLLHWIPGPHRHFTREGCWLKRDGEIRKSLVQWVQGDWGGLWYGDYLFAYEEEKTWWPSEEGNGLLKCLKGHIGINDVWAGTQDIRKWNWKMQPISHLKGSIYIPCVEHTKKYCPMYPASAQGAILNDPLRSLLGINSHDSILLW